MYPRAEQGDCGRCVGSSVQINLSDDYPMGQVFGVMASPVISSQIPGAATDTRKTD
jgi:hypothetical protein